MIWLTEFRQRFRVYRRIHGWSRLLFRHKAAAIGIEIQGRFPDHDNNATVLQGGRLQEALIELISEQGAVPVFIWAGTALDSPVLPHIARLAFRLDCPVHVIGQGPMLSEAQAEALIMSGIDSFSCNIAGQKMDTHQLCAEGDPAVLRDLALLLKNKAESVGRKLTTEARIPWHKATAAMAMDTFDSLNTTAFDRIVLAAPAYGQEFAHEPTVLSAFKNRSDSRHQTPSVVFDYLAGDIPADSLPGRHRLAGTCQIDRQIRMIRPSGAQYICPFKAEKSGLTEQIKSIGSCQRECLSPDLFPLSLKNK